MILHQNHQQLLNGSKFIFILYLILIFDLFSQTNFYQRAVDLFNQGRYAEATPLLEKILKDEPEDYETVAILLISGNYHLKNFEAARSYISWIEQKPISKKAKLIVLETRLAISVQQKDINEFKRSLIELNKFSISPTKLNEYTNLITEIYTSLNPEDKSELEKSISNPVLRFSLLQSFYLDAVEKLNSNQIEHLYFELIKIGIDYGFVSPRVIGILIPASKSKQKSVEEIITDGLKIALSQFNHKHDQNFELKIYKGNEKQLREALIELAKDLNVLCVIGPLYSSQFKELSILSDKLKLPLISPTATGSDIAIKLRFSFQFNPPLDVRGYSMASYAINNLKGSRFVILTSDKKFLNDLTKELRKTIKSSKGEIVLDINWNESTKNLKSKIREIRNAGLKRDNVIRFNQMLDFSTEQLILSYGYSQSYIDSLKAVEAEVSIYDLFGPSAEKICNLNKISYYKRARNEVDNLDVAVSSIDAIFIPLSETQIIAAVANEIARQNIKAKIIGNDIWNSIDELNKGYPATNGVIFTSDFYLDYSDKEIQKLNSIIKQVPGITLNRNFFYGYESLNKVLQIWNSNLNRLNFYDRIISDQNYNGLTTDIMINKDGINGSIFILEYKNRKSQKIGKVISN